MNGSPEISEPLEMEPLEMEPLEMEPLEMEPEPEARFYLRPLGWLTTPKIGLFDGQGNLLEELEFEPVTVFYPHGQNLHRLQQEYIEHARARLQERR